MGIWHQGTLDSGLPLRKAAVKRGLKQVGRPRIRLSSMAPAWKAQSLEVDSQYALTK